MTRKDEFADWLSGAEAQGEHERQPRPSTWSLDVPAAILVLAILAAILLAGISLARAADCQIAGNVSRSGKVYHLPGTTAWSTTTIDEAHGEGWFCSVEEAEAAGWRPVRAREAEPRAESENPFR